MPSIARSPARPILTDLPPEVAQVLTDSFDAYGLEVVVNGEAFRWDEITEVEVAKAARAIGPAGWFVRHLVHGEDRYHVGIYAGEREQIIPNVTLPVVQAILGAIAYYAPRPIPYTGPANIVKLVP
jgi:non-ribosomal peptide synthetase component F